MDASAAKPGLEAQRLEERLRAESAALDLAWSTLATAHAERTRTEAPAASLRRDPAFAAAVSRIAEFLGVRYQADQRRPVVEIRTRELTLAERIESLALPSGLQPRAVKLEPGWWKRDFGALLCLTAKDQPIVLLSERGRKIVFDPASQSESNLDPALARTLGAAAFTFYRLLPAEPVGLAAITRFCLSGLGRELWLLILFGAVQGLLGVAPAVAAGVLFDSLIPAADRPGVAVITGVLALCGLAAALLNGASACLLTRVETKASMSLQAALWRRLLMLPAEFFRRFSSADLASRGTGIDAIQRTLTGPVTSAILASVFSIIQLPVLFYYSWKLAIPATAALGLALAFSAFSGAIQMRLQREELMQRSAVSTFVFGVARGIAKLRVNGAENRILLAWARMTTPAHRMSVQARRAAGLRSVFLAAYPGLCALLLYGLGSTIAQPSHPGHFLAFLLAFAQLLAGVTLMSSAISGVAAAIPHLERLRPILEEPSEIRPGANQPGPLRGHILVDRVTFRYNRQQGAVLRNVSVEARPGEFIGIVGPSGSGKSTLLRLLLGFDRPESGAIFFDGQNADQLDMSAVRRQMGVVLQDTRLMPGDIRANIAGSTDRTDEEIWRAAGIAAIADDIRAMPMGLQTLVSDDAGPISGGQRQRLLIARAIASSPRVVIMDEATSALDNLTQAAVMENMRPLRATRIVIAHRLSTIRECDRIYVLEDGCVVESGTYEELIVRGRVFPELARRQQA